MLARDPARILAAGLVALTGVAGCSSPSGSAGNDGPSLVKLAALLTHGLADGERRVVYGMGGGKTAAVKSAPATFVWTLSAKPAGRSALNAPDVSFTYTFEETDHCRVRATVEMTGEDEAKEVIYDFRDLKGVTVEAQTSGMAADTSADFGVNALWVRFDPPLEGDYQSAASLLFTSLDQESLQGAADQLARMCR